MKKIIIIGGGISGCITAYYLSSKGHDVEIYEKSKNIGGIMRDYQFDNDIYFSGPHYLHSDSFWTKDLLKNETTKKLLKKINYSFASYTDLFDETVFSRDFAHPTIKKKFKEIKKRKIFSETLFDRFKFYQNTISKELIEWSKNFTPNFKNLHVNCKDVMAIGRLYFQNDHAKITQLKKKKIIYDNLLGVPDKNYKVIEPIIPKKGYNFFFSKFKTFLEKKKIKVNLNTSIKIKKINNTIKLICKEKELKADYFVWCANPVPLFLFLKDTKIDNPFTKAYLAFYKIKKNPNKIKDIYIQIFSKKNSITRVYIYEINGKTKVTVEGLNSNNNLNSLKITEFISKLLKKIDPKIELSNEMKLKNIVKHNLFTVNDYNSFINYDKKYKKYRIISGAWHINTREKKINEIIKKIDKLGL